MISKLKGVCLTPRLIPKCEHPVQLGASGHGNNAVSSARECKPVHPHRTFNAVVAGSSPARLTIIFNKLDGIVRLFFALTLHLTLHLFCSRMAFPGRSAQEKTIPFRIGATITRNGSEAMNCMSGLPPGRVDRR
jgi:hypothetical protein